MPELEITNQSPGVRVIVPLLPRGLTGNAIVSAQRTLLDEYIAAVGFGELVCWYYTPMALLFSDHLAPTVTVYDCMDELSAFQDAPSEMIEQEQRLFSRADVVFVGGASLYQSKRTQHNNAYLFPSSIDHAHFASAREDMEDPADQADIPHPRIGFYGVLDERLDRKLLSELASARPEWHLVLLGPVVKIHEDELPRAANLHYLGQKTYAELPSYLANWDVAMLPFALNQATRFISPTKTPEYLAAGKPVVSTPIQDVVKPYGERGFVEIGGNATQFVNAIEKCLQKKKDDSWLGAVSHFLAGNSWDKTSDGMWKEIERCKPQARQVPQFK